MEEWRTIRQSRGQYEVSNKGRVRNKRTGRFLAIKESRGVRRITLHGYMGGVSYTVGRLMAMAFRPDIKELEYVRHKDKTKGDVLENLIIMEKEDGNED